MLLLIVSVYLSRGRTSPVMKKPEEKPPRKNSSAIDRSEPAQYGHDPIIDLAVVLGERPTPMVERIRGDVLQVSEEERLLRRRKRPERDVVAELRVVEEAGQPHQRAVPIEEVRRVDRLHVAQVIGECLIPGHLVQVAKQTIHADVQTAERGLDDVEAHPGRELAGDRVGQSQRGIRSLGAWVGILSGCGGRNAERSDRERQERESGEPSASA